jgi:hypothetical protein
MQAIVVNNISSTSNGDGEAIRKTTTTQNARAKVFDQNLEKIIRLDRFNAKIRNDSKSEMRLTRVLTAAVRSPSAAAAGATKVHRKENYSKSGKGRRMVQETEVAGRDNEKYLMIGNSRSSVQQAKQSRHQPTITKKVKAKMRQMKEDQKLRNLIHRVQKDAKQNQKTHIVLPK